MTQPFAPEKVLNIVFCHCQTSCGVLCGCRKSGIECSSTYIHFYDSTCTNTSRILNPDEKVKDEEDEEGVQGEEDIQC